MSDRDILLDVSRLIWRLWRGGLPTGIDRVCLAYADYFGPRAQAVVQYRGRYLVLTPEHSDQLFEIFSAGPDRFRSKMARLGARALPRSRYRPIKRGLLYLNIGHTGLDELSLGPWLEENDLRAVYLIHDLIPLLHPEYCRAGESGKHRRRMRNVLATASGIIGNSQATIEDLEAFARADGMALPRSIAAWIAGPPVPTEVNPIHFDRPHFIMVGTIEARKNHLLILHIWRRLIARRGHSAPLLVIVGQRGWEASQALAMLDRAVDLRGHVLERGNCEDHELAGLIAGAQALLMPSFAEGFGLPVSEALQLGTPVIASNLPVFREFAFDIPTYLDPLDGLGWQSSIEAFCPESLAMRRQKRTSNDYRAPDWESHFELVVPWLHTLL